MYPATVKISGHSSDIQPQFRYPATVQIQEHGWNTLYSLVGSNDHGDVCKHNSKVKYSHHLEVAQFWLACMDNKFTDVSTQIMTNVTLKNSTRNN